MRDGKEEASRLARSAGEGAASFLKFEIIRYRRTSIRF